MKLKILCSKMIGQLWLTLIGAKMRMQSYTIDKKSGKKMSFFIQLL